MKLPVLLVRRFCTKLCASCDCSVECGVGVGGGVFGKPGRPWCMDRVSVRPFRPGAVSQNFPFPCCGPGFWVFCWFFLYCRLGGLCDPLGWWGFCGVRSPITRVRMRSSSPELYPVPTIARPMAAFCGRQEGWWAGGFLRRRSGALPHSRRCPLWCRLRREEGDERFVSPRNEGWGLVPLFSFLRFASSHKTMVAFLGCRRCGLLCFSLVARSRVPALRDTAVWSALLLEEQKFDGGWFLVAGAVWVGRPCGYFPAWICGCLRWMGACWG